MDLGYFQARMRFLLLLLCRDNNNNKQVQVIVLQNWAENTKSLKIWMIQQKTNTVKIFKRNSLVFDFQYRKCSQFTYWIFKHSFVLAFFLLSIPLFKLWRQRVAYLTFHCLSHRSSAIEKPWRNKRKRKERNQKKGQSGPRWGRLRWISDLVGLSLVLSFSLTHKLPDRLLVI